MKRSSANYVFTADINSANDMLTLASLRKGIAASNRGCTQKQRVVVRGRKPVMKMMVPAGYFNKASRSAVSYDRGGNIVGGIKNATMLDVYVYAR